MADWSKPLPVGWDDQVMLPDPAPGSVPLPVRTSSGQVMLSAPDGPGALPTDLFDKLNQVPFASTLGSALVGLANTDVVRGTIGLVAHAAGALNGDEGEEYVRGLEGQLDQLAKVAQSAKGSNAAYEIARIGGNIYSWMSVFRAGTALGGVALGKLAQTAPGKFPALAARWAPTAAAAEVLPRITALERLIPAVGGASAVAAVEGAVTLGEQEDIDLSEAMKAAAVAGGLTLAGEAAFAGLGMLTKRGRGWVDETVLKAKHKALLSDPVAAKYAEAETKHLAMQAEFKTKLDVARQEVSLYRAYKEAAKPGPRKAVQGVKGFLSSAQASKLMAEKKLAVHELAADLRDSAVAIERSSTLLEAWTTTGWFDEGLAGYTSMKWMGPNLGFLKKAFVQNFYTPEGMMGEMGPVSRLALKLTDDVNIDHFIFKGVTGGGLAETMKKAAAAMRAAGHKAPRRVKPGDGRFFSPVVEAYTKPGGGIAEVERQFGREVTDVFKGMLKMLDTVEDLRRAGVPVKMPTGEELAAAGQSNFFPQFLRQRSSFKRTVDSVAKYMVNKRGMDPETALAEASYMLNQANPSRLRMLSLDLVNMPGTTGEKLAAGMDVLDDPFAALFKYVSGVDHLYQTARRFGPNNEVRRSLLEMAHKSGEDRVLLKQLLDHVAGRRWDTGMMAQYVNAANDLEAAARLGYMVIPNLFQPVANNPLVFGLRESAKGLFNTMRGEKIPGRSIRLGAAYKQSMMDFMMEHFAGTGGRETWSAKIADRTLQLIGANGMERFHRYSTSITGHHWMARKLAQATAGRLKGQALDTARRTFSDMGLDLAAGVRRAQAGYEAFTEPEWTRALFRAARRTQFTPTGALKPLAWGTWPGRAFYLFNTFALNQGRLIRDYVFAESARGNFGPAAHFMALNPIIGEAIGGLQEVAKGRERPDDLVPRMIDNLIITGTFAMGTTGALVLAGYTQPQLRNFIPPAFRDPAEFGLALYRGVMQEDLGSFTRQVGNLPTVDLAVKAIKGAGALTALTVEQLMELDVLQQRAEGAEGYEVGGEWELPLTLEELGTQQRQPPR